MMHVSKHINLMAVGVFVLFIAGIIATASYAAISPDAIVGLWLFDDLEDVQDDITADISGNGHDGTLNGFPEIVSGKFGEALKFDGGDDYVNCGNAESLNLDIFTVAFWASIPTTQGWTHMVSKGDHVTSGDPGSVNWGVMMRSAEMAFLFEIFEDTEWTGISGPTVQEDEWQHLVATYDGDRMEFFLNGASVGSSAGVKIKLDASRSFIIGARAAAGTPSSYFNGSIDEVAFFDEVLALEDIQSLMNEGIAEALNLTAVLPASKAITTWARIKEKY